MTDLVSGSITFTGLGSGTDFDEITSQLVEVESIHKEQLESWKAEWEEKVDAIQELNTALLTLQSTLAGMDTMNEFMAKDVTSTYTSLLSATADSTADEGTHEVEIGQLAQAATCVTTIGYTSADSVLTSNAATFDYAYNDPDSKNGLTAVTVDVPAGTTLDELADLINQDPDNPGVRASVISDGTNYYLQVRGLDLGADANLFISNGSLTGFAAADFDVTQTNQDSKIKVDGWPVAADSWITSSSNVVTDAITGVSLSLLGASAGTTISVTVSTDTDTIKENIKTFVDSINEVRTLYMELTQYDADSETASVMTGNYAFQLVSSIVKSAVAAKGTGFEYYNAETGGGDLFTSLSQLGILTDADESSLTKGLLVIDEELLDDALDADAVAVARLFAADFEADEDVTSGTFKYYNHVSSITEAGEYDVSYTISGGKVVSASIDGKEASFSSNAGEWFITATADGGARGLAIKIIDKSDGTSSGTVTLKQGKNGELADLLDDLTNENSGPLNILEDNYNDIITNIETKIMNEEERLARYAQNLTEKWARLEALLSEYDQINTSLENQIAQLES
ncbi:MAG: flagellar filament capping protein FliD [Desulfovibrionaceae bacterium]